MRTLQTRGALAALLTLAVSACGGGGGGGGDSVVVVDTGTLNLAITDAPVDSARQVLVQFTGVSVQAAGGGTTAFALAGNSQTCQDLLDGVPPALPDPNEPVVRCIDLLALQGSATNLLLDDEELPAGDYSWMRLDVQAERGVMDSIIVLDDGSEESLWVPSGSQSGLKLNTPFRITADREHNLVIDFDLRKSVTDPQGSFPDYILRPSLRLIDLGASGSIAGTVDAALLTTDNCTADAYAVYVYEGALAEVGDEGSAFPPLASAAVVLDGDLGLWRYEVGFLPAGDYTVAFTCEAANDDPEQANDPIAFVGSADNPVPVSFGQQSIADFHAGG